MSVMWKLPEDILHSVYGEWLGWKDLSSLDVACVEKTDREAWLSSLNDLRISRGDVGVSNAKMRVFSIWLVNRKVLYVEWFPVSASALEDLVGGGLDIMESYCSALRSIEIDTRTTSDLSKEEQLKSNLSVFLSHCHNLQGVTAWMNIIDRQAKQLSDVMMQVLVEELRENSLIKISLRYIRRYHERHVMVTNLLRKHASSLRDLHIFIKDGMGIDLITSTLIENKIHLASLNFYTSCEHLQTMNAFISYLSSAGELLEVVKVGCGVLGSSDVNDLVVALSTSCPKLTSLVISNTAICSAENLRHLFEQCPHLQDVFIAEAIQTCNENNSVTIEVQDTNDDWAVCLSHVLRRKKREQIRIRAITSEACLISLLRDLPHLNCLYLAPFNDNQYTDATLAAITEHAACLTELNFPASYPSLFTFSDTMLTELIKSCELIESLVMRCCGLETMVAVSKHSSLSIVNLITSDSVSEEMLEGLLLNEKNLVTGADSVKSDKIDDGSTRTYLSVSRYCVYN
eukprot:scaffold954_cov173-Ochromonas_danica.AAC.8